MGYVLFYLMLICLIFFSQVWFEGIVTDCVDSALFTCYSVQYEDDGKVEHYIDEGDLRPRASRIIRPSEDAATNKCNVFNIDNIRNFRMSYSADDLVISHRPYLHTPKTTSRRRWSIDFSHTHPPRPSTLPHTPQQSLQQKRFLNESPDLFLPLAARCANPSCRKMTLFRCHRCGSSFSCSAACQKQVSFSTILNIHYRQPFLVMTVHVILERKTP